MERSKIAPLVLRLGRQKLRQQAKPQCQFLCSPFSTTLCRPAAPLPPSPEEAAKAESHSPPPQDPSNGSAVSPSPRKTGQNRRSLRPLLWATSFILIGVAANAVMRAIVFPPPLPEPDTEEDAAYVSRIKSDLNNLPIVLELRKDRAAWREYDPYSQREAFGSGSSREEAELEQHMTAGALRGSRGLPVLRSFYNAAEEREISVIFFGGAVSGWPGVTHGGLIMTVLKEAIERAANGPSFVSKSGDTKSVALPGEEGLGHQRERKGCESLTLTYKKPTRANAFYVIRAEVEGANPEKPGHVMVQATLEDAVNGTVTVSSEGYCKRTGAVGAAQTAVSNSAGGLWNGITGLFGPTT